ncbi:MAG: hypothetical protein IPL52_14225 [Flavobacteriales bacterium]|nr:hypothetical protein [Flavobacteriales bacterium]
MLTSTVDQLRKDLSLTAEELPVPDVGDGAFEFLRSHVLIALERWTRSSATAFSRAVNRVDLTEGMVKTATDRGGLHELAGLMVIRCLQKVLSRARYAGRF